MRRVMRWVVGFVIINVIFWGVQALIRKFTAPNNNNVQIDNSNGHLTNPLTGDAPQDANNEGTEDAFDVSRSLQNHVLDAYVIALNDKDDVAKEKINKIKNEVLIIQEKYQGTALETDINITLQKIDALLNAVDSGNIDKYLKDSDFRVVTIEFPDAKEDNKILMLTRS